MRGGRLASLCFLSAVVNAAEEPATSKVYGGLEIAAHAFPSPVPPHEQELDASVLPILGWVPSDDFTLEVGAKFQFRIIRSGGGSRFRTQDWAELSDYGQVIRFLRAGSDASRLQLRLGAFEAQTLGAGHLISRYSNRTNPNYHPGGATLTGYFGPTQTELLVSDFLGARVFAAEERLDLGSLVAGAAASNRVYASASLAHDAGLAGGNVSALTQGYVDLTAEFYKSPSIQAFANVGMGLRLGLQRPDAGGAIGLGADTYPFGARLSAKAELRFQGGAFQHGAIGPTYELSRFSAIGDGGPGVADERLPQGATLYGEVSFSSGDSKRHRIVLTSGVQRFFRGRTDADFIFSGSLAGGSPVASVRLSAVGIGQRARYALAAQLRVRLSPSLYLLGEGGTLYFPQVDNSLVSAWFSSAGVGLDFEG